MAGNLELLRGGVEAYLRGEWLEAGRLLHPDVVWEESDAGFTGLAPRYEGPEGVARWMREVLSSWADFNSGVGEMLEAGEHVIVAVELSARGKGSGVEVTGTFWNLLTFKDGLIVRRRVFSDRDDAIAATQGS